MSRHDRAFCSGFRTLELFGNDNLACLLEVASFFQSLLQLFLEALCACEAERLVRLFSEHLLSVVPALLYRYNFSLNIILVGNNVRCHLVLAAGYGKLIQE